MAGVLHMHNVFRLNLDREEAPGGLDTCGAHVLVVQAVSQRVSSKLVVT